MLFRATRNLIWISLNALLMAVSFAQPTSSIPLSPMEGDSALPTIESKLPPCQGSSPQSWNLCTGSYTFPNGNSYTGEWRNGQRHGVGKLLIVAKGRSTDNYIGSEIPSIYVGEFQSNKLNGHGVWLEKTGNKYEGDFVNNILVKLNNLSTQNFGGDTEKFKKKCEAYGLKYGSGDFAQCMLSQEQMANQNTQREADRENQRQIQDSANATKSIDWLRLANEFAKPPQFMPAPCNGGMMSPPGQTTNCR